LDREIEFAYSRRLTLRTTFVPRDGPAPGGAGTAKSRRQFCSPILILVRLSAWMGLHRGKAGDDRFFSRATGRVRLARMPTVRFDHCGEQFAAMLMGRDFPKDG